jgi:hypothetical protein
LSVSGAPWDHFESQPPHNSAANSGPPRSVNTRDPESSDGTNAAAQPLHAAVSCVGTCFSIIVVGVMGVV